MDHSQVIKYFDEYIKKYSPYQDNETYLALMEYISQTFTKELYENIPTQFKQLYEDNYIDIDMYDILLRNIGVPDKILSKLKINEKIILFKNFTDFYRYRGDVYFFDKVSKLFEGADTLFDIYELYIDYDEAMQDWVFKPYKLVKNTNLELLTDNIRYDQIYDNIPSFLITRQQLTTHKNNKEIVLPVKSNILLLDYSFTYNLSEMMHLVNATFLKQYKKKEITCYFIADEFIFTLREFFIIWYYILLRCYDSSIGDVPLQWIIEYIDSSNPYTLSNIDEILEEYKLVTTALQSRNFYEKYISRPFKNFTYSAPHESTDFEYLLTSDFIEYIDSRIVESIMDDKQVYNIILDELLNSLVLDISTTYDEYYVKYSEYFINSLTRITLDPKLTSSYLLMHNYKPYHTELLSAYNELIFSNSNFDLAAPDAYKVQFLYDMQVLDNLNKVDYYITNFIYNSFNALTFNENTLSKFVLEIQKDLEILEKSNFKYSKFNISNLEQVDVNKIDVDLTQIFQLLPIEYSKINTLQNAFNKLTVDGEFIINYLTQLNSTFTFFDYTIKKIHNLFSSFNNLTDVSKSNYNNILQDILEKIEYTVFEVLGKTSDTLLTTEFLETIYNILFNVVNNISEDLKIDYNQIEQSGKSTINHDFNFINSKDKIYTFNLSEYIGIGKLNIGDKVKYIHDDDVHYGVIKRFESDHIKLASEYTGSTISGQLMKQSSPVLDIVGRISLSAVKLIDSLLTTEFLTLIQNIFLTTVHTTEDISNINSTKIFELSLEKSESILFEQLTNLIDSLSISDFEHSKLKLQVVKLLSLYDQAICKYMVYGSEVTDLLDEQGTTDLKIAPFTDLLSSTEFLSLVYNLIFSSLNIIVDKSNTIYQQAATDSQTILEEILIFQL